MTAKRQLAAAIGALCWGVTACGGNGGGNPTGPSGGGSPTVGATITITSAGISLQQVRVQAGEAVRFVNNDTVAHVPSSNPHPAHSDCAAMAEVGTLQPGQSATTAAFATARSCGFHDHNNPADARFAGQILVGNAAAEPGPGY